MKNNLFLASIFSISLFMPLTGCATLQDGLDAVNSGLESANNTLSSVLGKSKTTDNNSDPVVVNKSKSNNCKYTLIVLLILKFVNKKRKL